MMSIGDQKSIYCALNHLSSVDYNQLKTRKLVSLFKSLVKEKKLDVISSESCIQSVVIPGNDEVKKMEQKMRDSGFWVKAILSPTVPVRKERIRICFHEFNTEEQVRKLVQILRDE